MWRHGLLPLLCEMDPRHLFFSGSFPGTLVGLVTAWDCPGQLRFQLCCLITLRSPPMVIITSPAGFRSENTHSILMCLRLSPRKPESLPQYLLVLSFCLLSLSLCIKPLLCKKIANNINHTDVVGMLTYSKMMGNHFTNNIPCKVSRAIAGMEHVPGIAQKSGYYPKA